MQAIRPKNKNLPNVEDLIPILVMKAVQPREEGSLR